MWILHLATWDAKSRPKIGSIGSSPMRSWAEVASAKGPAVFRGGYGSMMITWIVFLLFQHVSTCFNRCQVFFLRNCTVIWSCLDICCPYYPSRTEVFSRATWRPRHVVAIKRHGDGNWQGLVGHWFMGISPVQRECGGNIQDQARKVWP